jgi:hypothetical protein
LTPGDVARCSVALVVAAAFAEVVTDVWAVPALVAGCDAAVDAFVTVVAVPAPQAASDTAAAVAAAPARNRRRLGRFTGKMGCGTGTRAMVSVLSVRRHYRAVVVASQAARRLLIHRRPSILGIDQGPTTMKPSAPCHRLVHTGILA